MEITEEIFSLIKNEINGKPLEETEYNIKKLYVVSKWHDLAHLVGDALFRNELLPENKVGEAFKEQMMLAVLRVEQQTAELERIKQTLKSAKIPFIPLKGAVLRQYYPEPWMRTSCDIDILVKKEDYFATSKYLSEKLGYNVKNYNSHDVSLYSASNIHIELHHSLIEENYLAVANKLLEKVWDFAISYKNNMEYRLSAEMFYFYHIAHMAKHFRNGGCGIRPFIDLWLLNYKVEFNMQKRDNLLVEGGLLKFAGVCEKLAKVWFENQQHDATTKLLQEYILDGGVYGSIKNRTSIAKGTMKKRRIGSYLWKPYDELKYIYPNLVKHKWLLPFYEIKRWFRLLFGGAVLYKLKEKRIINNIEKEQFQRIDKLISDLGLEQE